MWRWLADRVVPRGAVSLRLYGFTLSNGIIYPPMTREELLGEIARMPTRPQTWGAHRREALRSGRPQSANPTDVVQPSPETHNAAEAVTWAEWRPT